MTLTKRYIVCALIYILVPTCFCDYSYSAPRNGKLFLQIVKQPQGVILAECNVAPGEHFFIDYAHSSDHTPIHDVFLIDEQGCIVLIEETYEWYGSGLEFQSGSDSTLSFEGTKTRVLLHRSFPHFLLRVGRVANHIVTCRDRKIPLKNLTAGGDLVLIRIVER